VSTETNIDLMPFCDPDTTRFAIRTPFVQAGVLYATDGRIMATIPAAGEPDTVREDGGRLPRDCASIMAAYGSIAECEWEEMPGPNLDCAECDGTGKADCSHCHGEVIHECKCGHTHDCDNCEDGKVTCSCTVEFGNRRVATWLVEKMRKLPGVQWAVASPEPTSQVFFRFDQGGRGCVMPLDPRYT
jgi:hypothetical protein